MANTTDVDGKGIVLLICAGAAALVGIYSAYLYLSNKPDPLNKVIWKIKVGDCEKSLSSWPLSHYVLFFTLGFYLPQHAHLILLLGLIWEVFEHLLGGLQEHMGINIAPAESSGEVQYKRWSSGSRMGVVMNIVGVLTGVGLRHMVTSKEEACK